jgi:hypothetical protein
LLKQFIPTADDPERYRVKEQARQQALEYQLVHGAMIQTHFRASMQLGTWHVQGMYLITPSGKLIAGHNRSLNIEATLSDMRKGLEAYAKMPREDRLLSRAPDPKKDRMFAERERPRPPIDGLVLRVVGRGLDENVAEGCQLAPKYYILDRLWYTREEAMQFLPTTLRPGQKKEITGPVLNGLAQLYLIARGSYWHEPDVKELRLTSEVTEAAGPTVRLKLSGRAVLHANDQFNQNKYRPDLLGYVTYDTEKRGFTAFDLLAYGLHTIGTVDMKPSGPGHIPMAFLFTLTGSDQNGEQVPTKLGAYRFVKLQSAP